MNGLQICWKKVSTFEYCWLNLIIDFCIFGIYASFASSRNVLKTRFDWAEEIDGFISFSLYAAVWATLFKVYKTGKFTGIIALIWITVRLFVSAVLIIVSLVFFLGILVALLISPVYVLFIPWSIFSGLIGIYAHNTYLLYVIIVQKRFFEVQELVDPGDDVYLRMPVE